MTNRAPWEELRRKYPLKAAKWQPQYVGFETIPLEIVVDPRIFPFEVIQRVVMMLEDQIEEIEADQRSTSELLIRFQFFTDLIPEASEDLFHAKLICAHVMGYTREKTKDLQELLAMTADTITTKFQEAIQHVRTQRSQS
ncbi:hypothetical protein HYR99_18725 [Candidatus Poribacteria bacterium]|nr:hypothetical protein [Candidatus Poribacteria bacterium]